MTMLLMAAAIAATSALVEQAPALRSHSTGVVSTAGPVYLLPDAHRTPLRTLEARTIVRIGEIRGDWVQVTFNDAVLGARSGWMERKFLGLPHVAEPQRATRKPEPAVPPTAGQPPRPIQKIPTEPISPQGLATTLEQRSVLDRPSRDPIATHAPAASVPTPASCAQSQAMVHGLLELANARLENARLGNTAAEMRAAIDALQGIVRDVRTALVPCIASKPADPHASHAAAQAAGPAKPDPHAGHAMPAAPPAAVNPHAGHAAAAMPSMSDTPADIRKTLEAYDAAFVAKNLSGLAAFYHPDVTVDEGSGVNNGWANYRDTHLGPELESYEGLEYGHRNVAVQMLGEHAAYVTSELFLKANASGKPLDLIGRETLVLEHIDGAWKIRHQQMGVRARPVK